MVPIKEKNKSAKAKFNKQNGSQNFKSKISKKKKKNNEIAAKFHKMNGTKLVDAKNINKQGLNLNINKRQNETTDLKTKKKKRKIHLEKANVVKSDYQPEASKGNIKSVTSKTQSNPKFKKFKDRLTDRGYLTLCHILDSFDINQFLSEYWEKKPLLIQRQNSSFYENIFSAEAFDDILRSECVNFTKNLDVTSYQDGKRETHNPEGRAFASLVWDFYNNGCSVRFLNPQTFHKPVWELLAKLQEFFCSFCGANVYLTPPDTQGFAPHWDDIEAFILQLEGKKRWRVYQPRITEETLPRESSSNFGPEDDLGEPVIDCVLKAGDLLYFPRGFIHQGHTLSDAHSLHITVSTYQKTSWVDLFEKLLPAALANAAAEDVDFRRGLPIGYLRHLGISHSESQSQFRDNFIKKAKKLLNKLVENSPLDGAVDQMAKHFVHDSLPPVMTQADKENSVFYGGEFWLKDENRVVNRVEIGPDTRIRLMAKECVRLVTEENTLKLFYNVDNSREYHAEDLKYFEIDPELAPGVEALIDNYPEYVEVETLPLVELQDKLLLATSLWDKGIIRTHRPLPDAYADE